LKTGLDKIQSLQKKIFFSIQENQDELKPQNLDYIISPIYFDDSPIGFFDGASLGNICGIGLYLKFSSIHTFKEYFVGG